VQKNAQLCLLDALPKRRLWFSTELSSCSPKLPCYQTLGDLHLDFGAMEGIPAYRPVADLDTAVVLQLLRTGIYYKPKFLSSQPIPAIVVRWTSSRQGKISFRATLGPFRRTSDGRIGTDRLTFFFGEACAGPCQSWVELKKSGRLVSNITPTCCVSTTDGTTSYTRMARLRSQTLPP